MKKLTLLGALSVPLMSLTLLGCPEEKKPEVKATPSATAAVSATPSASVAATASAPAASGSAAATAANEDAMTEEDFEEEAQTNISESNMEEEFLKLEKEISAN
jgi:hypothetical protein